MELDKNEFFREATLRICSNLEIEKALFSTLVYLTKTMPISKMSLEYYDRDIDAMRTIATANPKKGFKVDLVTKLSDEAKQNAADKYKKDHKRIQLFKQPIKEKLAREMLSFHGIKATSLIVLILESGEKVLGTLAILTEGDEVLTDKDTELISLLSEPFAIALSNTLKHRSELKLFNREFFYEITMRICGNLEIEKGLQDCLHYLSQHMPADKMYLQKYEPDLEAIRIIARASMSNCEKMDQIIGITEKAKSAMQNATKQWKKGNLPQVFVINNPREEPVTISMLNALNEPPSSAMSLPLFVHNQIVGTMVLLAEGDDRFTEDNARLYHSLKIPFFVAMSNTLRHAEVVKLKDMLKDDNRYLQKELQQRSGDNIIGSNFGLKGVMEMVRHVAEMDSPVLLQGETGTGKDLIASAIHSSSSRKDGPFISVNCGAIPESLIDSELFGHEKGAFTGALSQKRGRFERADKGTIFLDEVGELPQQAQVRLLRVIQNREIERVGGTKTIPLDIRIIAATNKNLEKMTQEDLFRNDLFFRLNVFPIKVPPLRDRMSDIPALLQHFLTQKTRELKLHTIPKLESGSIDILMSYDWPGNVRELENIIERALILKKEGPINFMHLIQNTNIGKDQNHLPANNITNLDEINREHIKNILLQTGGKIHGPGGAAELLGINPSTLRNRIKKLKIQ